MHGIECLDETGFVFDRLGFDGDGDDGIVGLDGFQQDIARGIAQGVPRGHSLCFDKRHEGARLGGLDAIDMVGIETVEVFDLERASMGGVEDCVALL